jgi:hypothetical protein
MKADFHIKVISDIDYELPLPPPKAAAEFLQRKAIEFIQKWQDKFGDAYKKLSLGYSYLKTCKKASNSLPHD